MTQLPEAVEREVHLYEVHVFVNPMDVSFDVAHGAVDAVKGGSCVAVVPATERQWETCQGALSFLLQKQAPQVLDGHLVLYPSYFGAPFCTVEHRTGKLSVSLPGPIRAAAAAIGLIVLQQVRTNPDFVTAFAAANRNQPAPVRLVKGLHGQGIEHVPDLSRSPDFIGTRTTHSRRTPSEALSPHLELGSAGALNQHPRSHLPGGLGLGLHMLNDLKLTKNIANGDSTGYGRRFHTVDCGSSILPA